MARARPERERWQILYGIHLVEEALGAGRRRFRRLWVRQGGSRGAAVARLVARAAALGIPIREVPEAELRARVGSGTQPQGVLLEAGPLPLVSLADLSRAGEGPRRLVALDGVEDPQNAGAVARVAEAAGVAGLILTERRAPPLGPALARASAGAIERLPTARVTNLPRAIKTLKSQGFWSFGADPAGDRDLYCLPDRLLTGDALIVFGAEGRGLRPGVRNALDHLVSIPMRGELASLNVGAAAAIVLFEWARRAGSGVRA